MNTPSTQFAALVQAFFCRRLIDQQNASAETVASYRDTFRLLFGFLQETRNKAPSALQLGDLDAQTIASFLDYLESVRHNRASSRNVRRNIAGVRAERARQLRRNGRRRNYHR